MFALWAVQFLLSGLEKPLGPPELHNNLANGLAGLLSVAVEQVEKLAHLGKEVVTGLYLVWAAIALVIGIKGGTLKGITSFPQLMRDHW